MKKVLIPALLVSLLASSSAFAMANSNVAGPSIEGYKTKLMNTDQELIKMIAQRKGIRKKMLKFEKKNNLPTYDPFEDKSFEKTRLAFAVQYDVSPALVNEIFNTLNTTDLQTAEQSF
ncbi:chorismate mutase [Francisella sp. Scap27]|uniref:chorismate mutase n=1 Tax=Francisella sp. Scap27 TaxID=2589986 RepID=UPI0015BB3ACB|nr:chorismate mutase [Francisella sp. Scap27]QLE78434.1 chorismate mutase [Francisella sp. Scap27]